jgi:carboxyl-terminal processing protease
MPRSSFPRLLLTVGLPLIMLVFGWQIGMVYERMLLQGEIGAPVTVGAGTGSGNVLADPQKTTDLSLLWNVWRLLQQHYVDPNALQPTKLTYGAIEGLVSGIGDPYTVFMPPEENTAFRQTLQGKLEGIGAELSVKDGAVMIVAPLKGSPAEKAGLLPNDVISRVNGQSVDGLTLNEVVDRIRGPKGSTVTLQVYRTSKPEPLTLTIVRDNVNVPTVESKLLTTSGGTLGYVALNQFGENSMNEVRDALNKFKDKNLKGIILDLRYNGGGYLDGAVDLVSMFLRQGEVVSVESRGGETDRHDVSGHPLFPDTPMVVLINQGSASASEIAAGALQDHRRATIIGMKSFGKGTVQEVIDLPGGSSLRVTVAHWLTPNGKNLGKEGVQPDIKVERGANDVIGKSDTQLTAAEDWLLYRKDDSNVSSSSAASSVQ